VIGGAVLCDSLVGQDGLAVAGGRDTKGEWLNPETLNPKTLKPNP
jgi:hypothetical protein